MRGSRRALSSANSNERPVTPLLSLPPRGSDVVNDHDRAEAEKDAPVRLKHAGYGYDEFCDEMAALGIPVALHADHSMFTVEALDSENEPLAWERISRYSHRALDRAGRQVRAQLQVQGVLDPWTP
jgi:hypothetical protein